MELRKENILGKRRRKITQLKPILVRSVKPGQVLSASYSKQGHSSFPWNRL